MKPGCPTGHASVLVSGSIGEHVGAGKGAGGYDGRVGAVDVAVVDIMNGLADIDGAVFRRLRVIRPT